LPKAIGIRRYVQRFADGSIPKRYWQPFILLAQIHDCVSEWQHGIAQLRQNPELGHFAHTLSAQPYHRQFRNLAVAAQQLRMNSEPIYEFIESIDQSADVDDVCRALARLHPILKRFEDSAEAEYRRLTAESGIAPDALYPVRRAAPNSSNISDQKQKPKQRKRQTRQRNVTEKQLEVLKVVGECNQNFSEAARRLKLDRKTVMQHYKAGLRNAGKLAPKLLGKPSLRSAPMDGRDQLTVASIDDGPLASKYKPKGATGRRSQMQRKAS